MIKKVRWSKFVAIVAIHLLVLAGSASVAIAQVLWDAGGDGLLWSDPLNWDSDALPGSGDAVRIDIPDANCLIDSSVNAECSIVDVGYNTGPCYLNMTGGNLTTAGYFRIGYQADSNGVFNMSGGTVSGSGEMRIGYNDGAIGTLNMTGGEITIANKLHLGKESDGWLYLHGGTLNVTGGESDDLEIGKNSTGTGTLYMTGGVLNVTDKIKLGEGGGAGYIYLYGGTINSGNDEIAMGGTSIIDITEGTLVLVDEDDKNDATQFINELVGNGRITAYGGLGRVVAIFDGDATTTVTAQLSDPELAWNPSPSNFSTVEWTATGPTLSWSPGDYAVSHDVYFGTDWDDVNDANNTSGAWPEYKGNFDPCSYEPGRLELGKTYYWRIDEVNDNAWAPPGSPWKGTIWSFTIADFIIIDDFEDYDAGENQIWYAWLDGLGYGTEGTEPYYAGNGTGSEIGDGTTNSYTEEGIVHDGLQSMPYWYNNNKPDKAKYSEAKLTLSDTRDWTAEQVKALSLWFYGDPNNATTETMYVAVANRTGQPAVVYHDNPNAAQIDEWMEWNIDLKEFADKGVVLTDVNSIAIGFGNRNNPQAGGSGKMYFDDIRLYRPRCMPDVVKPVGDLDNDCDVDYEDVAMMADDWLIQDFIAVGTDAQLMNFPTDNSQWGGGALRLDGVDDWVDIDDSVMSNFHNRTIAIWVSISEFPEPYPYVFCFTNAGSDPYRIYIRTRGDAVVRARLVEDYLPDFPFEADTWHHLAVVLRDTDDGKCIGEFYGDGVLVGTLPGLPRHMGAADGVNLGSFNDGTGPYIKATYDDFRVYDTALSENEIKYLAEVAGGVAPTGNMMLHYNFDQLTGSIVQNVSTHMFARPIISAAELYEGEPEGSRSVNFRDFAVLAETWLEEQLWP